MKTDAVKAQSKPKNAKPTVMPRYLIGENIYQFDEPVKSGDIIEFNEMLSVVEEVVGHSLKLSHSNVKCGMHISNIYDV